MDLLPWHGIDMTPISFMFTGILLVWALTRLHFIDLAPVARERVIESMVDGLFVLDRQRRIVDINQAQVLIS